MNRVMIAVALCLAGCHDGEEGARSAQAESLALDVDIRETAEARLERDGDSLRVRLTLSRGFGVADDGAVLTGAGTVERFPEADVTLFAAQLSSAPVASGPCGAEPVSLALALHRRGSARRVAGSLTPYCGSGVWSGVPARNPLRLSSSAPKEE